MSSAKELKSLIYGISPTLSEHAIIVSGDKRPIQEILIDLIEHICYDLEFYKDAIKPFAEGYETRIGRRRLGLFIGDIGAVFDDHELHRAKDAYQKLLEM